VSRNQVEALMAEIGPFAGLAAVAEHGGEDAWSLLVDEDTVVHADLDADRGVLVLSGDVGLPNAADRARWYGTLLHYNAHWHATGGVRMAIEGADGPFVQVADVPLAELDLARLRQLVEGFASILSAWRTILQGPAPGASEADAPWPGATGAPFPGMIRG
jgi:hypothetical protein